MISVPHTFPHTHLLATQLCWFQKEDVTKQWNCCAYRWLCLLAGTNSCTHPWQSQQHFLIIISSSHSDYPQFFPVESHGDLFFLHSLEVLLFSKFDCTCMPHVCIQELWMHRVTEQGYCWTQEICKIYIINKFCPT